MTAEERRIAPGPWTPSRPPGPPVQPAPVQSDPVRPVYEGGRWRLFGLALSRMALTIVTLGLGRFWMLTRLRRHYWSSIRLGGDPFEYTGRAGEKLLGFLVAVATLAAYLLVVNLALTFVGLSWFEGHVAALQLPVLALAPLWFWASYRSRRYVLARTRWRGVRFGAEPGAWGYALRAMLWWGATLATLGLLYPLKQHRLDRYLKARSRFGDLAFAQTAGAGPLFASWLWVWVPAAAAASGLVWAAATGEGTVSRIDRESAGALAVVALAILFALARHQVFAFRHLASGAVLGGRTRARVELGIWPMIGIWLSGGLVMALGAGGAALTVFAAGAAGLALVFDAASLEAMERLMEGEGAALGALLPLLALALLYLPAVALWSALGHAFITHPTVRLVCRGMIIHDLEAAGRARQRPEDEAAEAGGFADALGADGAF